MLQTQRKGLVLHCMDTSKPHEHACAQLKGLFRVQPTVLAIYKLVGRLTLFNTELSQKRYWCGLRSQEGGGRGILYLSLPCHHQNGSCIKMGSNERHLNVSVIVRGKVTKTVSTGHTTFEEKGVQSYGVGFVHTNRTCFCSVTVLAVYIYIYIYIYISLQGLFLFSLSSGYINQQGLFLFSLSSGYINQQGLFLFSLSSGYINQQGLFLFRITVLYVCTHTHTHTPIGPIFVQSYNVGKIYIDWTKPIFVPRPVNRRCFISELNCWLD